MREMFAAFARRDFDACAAAFHPDARLEPVTVPADAQGSEGLLGALERDFADGRRYDVTIEEAKTFGDDVVVVGWMHEQTSDGLVDIPIAWVCRVTDGRIARMKGFHTRRQAFEYLGVKA